MKIESEERFSVVTLPRAEFTDNVRVSSITTDRQNGSTLSWGEHYVNYTAYDDAGNSAKCTLKITISCKYILYLFGIHFRREGRRFEREREEWYTYPFGLQSILKLVCCNDNRCMGRCFGLM